MVGILKNMMKISVPAFLDMILFSFAIMIDTMMIGKIGASAIAAVGLMFQPLLILCLFTEAIKPGVTYLVSQNRGRDDRAAVARVTAQSGLVTAGVSIVLLLVGLLATEPILLFMKAGMDTRPYATTYWQCALAGFTPYCLKFVFGSALIAVGEAKKVMWINLCSSASHLILNYLFINGNFGFPALGVLGAGIATAFSFYLACFACIAVFFSGKSYIDLRGLRLRDLRLDKAALRGALSIGGPALLGRVAIRISVLVMTKTVFALGTVAFAAYQVCYRFHDIAMTAGLAMGKAAASLIGQSVGAGETALARKYVKYACVSATAVVALINIAFVIFSTPLIALFNGEDHIQTMVFSSLLIMLCFQPFQGAAETLAGCLLGQGDTKSMFIATLVGIIAIRLTCCYLFTTVLFLGLSGVWLSHAVDEIFRFVYLMASYRRKAKLMHV